MAHQDSQGVIAKAVTPFSFRHPEAVPRPCIFHRPLPARLQALRGFPVPILAQAIPPAPAAWMHERPSACPMYSGMAPAAIRMPASLARDRFIRSAAPALGQVNLIQVFLRSVEIEVFQRTVDLVYDSFVLVASRHLPQRINHPQRSSV